jgi:uncharacterized YccA/Bax inhibitor family protein
LTVLLTTATVAWMTTFTPGAKGFEEISPIAWPMLIGGSLGGFVLALVTSFVPRWSPVTAPIYAAAQGLAMGVISVVTEVRFPGIVLQAVLLTSAVLAIMLFLYATRIIQPTKYFVIGVTAATGAIFLVYLGAFIFRLFFPDSPTVHGLLGNGLIGIGFSVFVVAIAALNLILDFGLIESGAAYGAPKYMEWYGGFSLLVTLVWLYLEILRLLTKMRSRD